MRNLQSYTTTSMSTQANEIELRHRPLKQLYPQVELRAKYRQSKLQQAKFNNPILVRFQPSQKYSKINGSCCENVIVPSSYEMGYLIGTLRDRLMKSKPLIISEQQSLFLFIRGKLMTSFKQKIGTCWQSNKEEDNILYIEYSDSTPF